MAKASNFPPMEIACAEVKAKLDAGESLLLLDCREREEHEITRIEQAMLLPMSELMARAAELETNKQDQIVVHCHHGGRSMRVTTWLRQNGFANVRSMAGGIDRWAEQIDTSLARY